MDKRRLIDWWYVVGLMALPLLFIALILAAGYIQGLIRYNPAYFSGEYLERYAVPSQVLFDLERAIREADGELLAQTQGADDVPQDLEPLPNVRSLIYWDSEGEYSNYMFMDTTNYRRYMQHLKLVEGRYVRVPEGFYYLIDSGGWIDTFGPIAAIWWLVVILFTAGVWVYRYTAALREEMYGPRPRLTK